MKIEVIKVNGSWITSLQIIIVAMGGVHAYLLVKIIMLKDSTIVNMKTNWRCMRGLKELKFYKITGNTWTIRDICSFTQTSSIQIAAHTAYSVSLDIVRGKKAFYDEEIVMKWVMAMANAFSETILVIKFAAVTFSHQSS